MSFAPLIDDILRVRDAAVQERTMIDLQPYLAKRLTKTRSDKPAARLRLAC